MRVFLCLIPSKCLMLMHKWFSYCILVMYGGFVSNTDRKRVDAFLQQSKRCGFCPPDLSLFDELLEDADSTLFHKVSTDSHHVLHQLLPPLSSASQNYSLRHQTHQFSLPDHTGHLMDCNFLIRSLFKDVY